MPEEALPDVLLKIMDSVKTVTDAVDGYRAECISRGYGPAAAESMALDLHKALIAKLLA